MGNDIRYMPEKLEQASNFANKIWNAAKFITKNMVTDEEVIVFKKMNDKSLKLEDKWILNKLNKLVVEITDNMEHYDLGIALDKIYNFIWNDFCNWYIEMVKTRLNGEDREDKTRVSFILNEVFCTSLKLLHPFMPFVTSEIYSSLITEDEKELMVSDWPTNNENIVFDKEEALIEKLQKMIIEIRNIRNEKHIHPSKKAKLIIVTQDNTKEIQESEGMLLKLTFADSMKIQTSKDNIPENAIHIIEEGIEFYFPAEGLIDFEEERKRLEEEKIRLEKEVARCEKMLSNPGFVNKAPQSKIEEEKTKLIKYREMLQTVLEQLCN